MSIGLVLIGFACGFICRQVILSHQIARARTQMQSDIDSLRSRFEVVRQQFEKDMKNASKHSNKK